MSKAPEKANIERLKKISKKIDGIFENCKIGVDEALRDENTLQAAIMMKFVNIYALVQGIQESNDLACLALFEKEDIASLSKTRNIAAHEYERINYDLIKKAIEQFLPPIKERIDNFLSMQKDKQIVQNSQDSAKSVLKMLGQAYIKKVKSGELKVPNLDIDNKSRDR